MQNINMRLVESIHLYSYQCMNAYASLHASIKSYAMHRTPEGLRENHTRKTIEK